MKRSEVNQILQKADGFIRSFGFRLPPFAYWSPETMQAQHGKIGRIMDARMGWDITDYGQGDFDNLGLFLFTLRNGTADDLKNNTGFCYAEKIMISRQDQISPMHRHVFKTEDIINRGGAKLAIQMYESGQDGNIDRKADVFVNTDGVQRQQKAGDVLTLEPGESVTLNPGNWHKFWGDGGDVLIGEVSAVNDDLSDNIFEDPIGRFADIVEDTAAKHLLVSDYGSYFPKNK
ncbi:MAG: D-lyxose/D-mannose family sugar isomerase [Rhodobacteraceae bacterium]|nr:D-lyxose/D-mannose family sugar isomerase [Paracoccaceae bacterium]